MKLLQFLVIEDDGTATLQSATGGTAQSGDITTLQDPLLFLRMQQLKQLQSRQLR